MSKPKEQIPFVDVHQFEMGKKLINGDVVRYYITVLERFRHHYTGEPVYKIREETCGVFENASITSERYVAHWELDYMLEQRSSTKRDHILGIER